MKVQIRPLSSVQPYGKNAKKHPGDQVKKIAESIREFGFNQPLVVDKEGVIIVGHGRLEAAKELGMLEVPVLELDLTEDQAKAYRLADNKLNESEWDMDLVIEELKALTPDMVDLTGFSRDLLIESDDKDDQVPETPAEPQTKLGDIYHLGKHILVCGDSTDIATYDKLELGTGAEMVFTDPPYNVNYQGSGKNTSRTILNDKMEDTAFLAFLTDTFHAMYPMTKKGAGWYVFHSSTTQATFEAALKANDLKIITQLIWNKPSIGLGMADYRPKHEPFFYVAKTDAEPQFYGDRSNGTVVDFHKSEEKLAAWARQQKRLEEEGKTTIWTMKRAPVQDYVHPTQKPVELITYALQNSSKADDTVLDPFGGSGSTLIACEKLERSARLIELDPAFCDVIVQRYLDYTGYGYVMKNGIETSWQT